MVECATPGCHEEAKLRCPTCEKLSIPRKLSLFCTQLCFKSSWKLHKSIHTAAKKTTTDKRRDLKVTGDGRVLRRIFQDDEFKFTGPLRNHSVAFPLRTVPEHVGKPDYAATGVPKFEELFNARMGKRVKVWNESEIERMRKVCRLAREVLDIAVRASGVGVTTAEIDNVVYEACMERDSYPSPLNYYWFPASCCTSVNEVICHGIPDSRPLEEGDVLNIDITLYYNGFHGDLNETILIGAPSPKNVEQRKLIKSAYDALHAAISHVKPKVLFRELGGVIERVCSSNGHDVVRAYCGHGIGTGFHTAPSVPHYRKNKAVGTMKPGMIFTIEPMVNQGSWRDVMWPDKWTAVTADGKLSAQFEHTLLVTENGCEVLTARLEDGPKFWWEEEHHMNGGNTA
eukprot:Plantae.Rhodophyta-Hildenbrandia_rubra.ctg14049.p1 GENE.Plantae.Rhodophyta-Hildenbrandia_rubra.ctg14049~~Plantae.Rhodophyta-Hildenbrandia_rubra.ctg14049.p1  ORF type:complete len:399 (+),score=67.60 Plantae.Rhodophyta-Hildenbrandia_rubra.ctg14049:72-1268(+)